MLIKEKSQIENTLEIVDGKVVLSPLPVQNESE